MPEPQAAKEQSIYNRDMATPYECEDQGATTLERIRFVTGPVLLGIVIGKLWFNKAESWMFTTDRFQASVGMNSYYGILIWGNFQVMYVAKVGKTYGICPRQWTWRCLWNCTGCFNYWACEIFAVQRTWANYNHTQCHAGLEMDAGMAMLSDYILTPTFIQFFFATPGPWQYLDLTFWGVYCCARHPQIRVGRATALAIFMFFGGGIGWMSLRVVANMGGAVGQVFALVIFAYKRLNIFGEWFGESHDNAFKGEQVVVGSYDTLIHWNLSIVASMIAAKTPVEVVQFIVVDWMLFSTRVTLLARYGMKTCPKLITFGVTQQIDNYPSPLPNHVVAAGAKTAMRCQQAYFTLAEGESMTQDFLIFLLMIAGRWNVGKETDVLWLVPSRTILVPFIYTFADFVQDFLADHVAGKFSNFSFLYKNSGWFKRCYWWNHLAMAGLYTNGYLKQFGQYEGHVFTHRLPSAPLATEWHVALFSWGHY